MTLLVLGLFVLNSFLGILDKNSFKKETSFVFFSHSFREQKGFILINKEKTSQREQTFHNRQKSFLRVKNSLLKSKKGPNFVFTQFPTAPLQNLPSKRYVKSNSFLNLQWFDLKIPASYQPEQREFKRKKAGSSNTPASSSLLKKQHKNTKRNPSNEMDFLKKFSQEKSPLEIHNKALSFLKEDKKEQAFLLLKKNIYQNFFLPSYFVLSHFEVPVSFVPFLWSVLLILLALTGLLLLFLSFKTPSPFKLKLLFLSLSLSLAFFFSKPLLFKKRVSSFQTMDLRSAPFKKAPVNASFSPNSDLIVLKQMEDWLVLQSRNKQTGWLKKQEVFQIF